MANRSPAYLTMQKYLLHPLQALAVRGLIMLVRLLPLDTASNLGGRLGRRLGPRTRYDRLARANLRRAMPEVTEDEAGRIVLGMWDNLGRMAFEYPHIKSIDIFKDPRFEVVGIEHLEGLRDDGMCGIFFSAHMANWELMPLTAGQAGLALDLVYRHPDNRHMQSLFEQRRPHPDSQLIPKGASGARLMMAALKGGRHLGMLVDQKMNDGIAVPFFGIEAWTAPALAQLALRFGCPVVPGRIERLDGARFRITIYPPLEITDSGDRHADILAVMTQVNAILEEWIRERPEQWLWAHRRWPD